MRMRSMLAQQGAPEQVVNGLRPDDGESCHATPLRRHAGALMPAASPAAGSVAFELFAQLFEQIVEAALFGLIPVRQ